MKMKKLKLIVLFLMVSGLALGQNAQVAKDTINTRLQVGLKYPAPRVQDQAAAMRYLVDWTAAGLAGKLSLADSAKFLRAGYIYSNPNWLILTKGFVGLGSVDNTSDANKPLSSAAITALAGKQALIGTGGLNLDRLNQSGAASGQTIQWNGSAWVAATPATGADALLAGNNTWTDANTFAGGILPASNNVGTIGTSTRGFNTIFSYKFQSPGQITVASNTSHISFQSSAEYGKMFNTGRWFIGPNPVDDGITTLNVGGRIKSNAGIDITGPDFTNGLTLNGGKILFAYGNRLVIQSPNFTGGGIHFGGTSQQTSIMQVLSTPSNPGVYIGKGANTPNKSQPSAGLELESDTQGMLPFRMTEANRLAVQNPAPWLHILQTDGDAGMYVNKPVVGWTKVY